MASKTRQYTPIPKSDLLPLIKRGLGRKEIAKELKTFNARVDFSLQLYGLKTLRALPGFKDRPRICELCHSVAVYRFCSTCRIRIRRFKNKNRAVAHLGGKCSRCSWTGDLAGYCFHHLRDKEYNVGYRLAISWETLKSEVNKCELLCANCHAEEHGGTSDTILGISMQYDQSIPTDFQEIRTKGRSNCEICDVPETIYRCQYKSFLCSSCRNHARIVHNKHMGIEILGSQCKHCGWTGNLATFQFHHPLNNKAFDINSKSGLRWELLQIEIKKCELLCARCHNIEHSNYSDPNFLKMAETYGVKVAPLARIETNNMLSRLKEERDKHHEH